MVTYHIVAMPCFRRLCSIQAVCRLTITAKAAPSSHLCNALTFHRLREFKLGSLSRTLFCIILQDGLYQAPCRHLLGPYARHLQAHRA